MRSEPIIPLIISAAVMAAPWAAADPAPDSAVTQAILQPASADIAATLGRPAHLNIKTLHVSGEWAFLYADLKELTGEPFTYEGTPFAEQAAHGTRSGRYAGLFRNSSGQWIRADSAIGPTSVAWDGWGQQYGAPSEIFQTS